jgi:hypothetical protein
MLSDNVGPRECPKLKKRRTTRARQQIFCAVYYRFFAFDRQCCGQDETELGDEGTMGITYRQQKANQLNAQQSTGPTSPEGKAASSKNATKHGLLAKCALMPGDDLNEYAALRAMLSEEFEPIGS